MLKKEIRILHVVGGMNRGGAETWLMHVLRNIDRKRFHFDFLVHTKKHCDYDDEIRSLGSTIIPCLNPSRPWRYTRNLYRVLRTYGPYDVIHSHVHHFSGFILRQAQKAKVPVRIAHSHNDTSITDRAAGTLRKVYLRLMEHLIRRHATMGLACSHKAASSLFGGDWIKDSRWRVLYCGIDIKPFRTPVNRDAVRKELGIPPDAFVIGHVGRFSEQKNHTFLVDIAVALLEQEPRSRLLLIGDGPLRPEIEKRVVQQGINKKFIFAGLRPDVPRLMAGAMDVFILTSLWEGLPLVLLEAQAAELPCIYSNCVTDEVDVVLPLVNRVSTKQPAATWASIILAAGHKTSQTRSNTKETISQSPFNIMFNIQKIEEIYGN